MASDLHATGDNDQSHTFPMSSAQRRVWLTEQVFSASAANTLTFGLRLQGILNATALDLALRLVIRRHEILRTTFDAADGQPVQRVQAASAPVLTRIDLSQEPAPEQAAYAATRALAATPFDLQRGPAIRALLLQLAPDQHVLFCTLHHIVADGWSLRLLSREIAIGYAALSEGCRPALPPLPVQYADCAAWEAVWLESEEFRDQLARYANGLAGLPPAPSLSLRRGGDTVPPEAGGSRALALAPELVSALRAAAQRQGVTVFVLALATFQLLLWQVLGDDTPVVGVPVARRNRVEFEELIGLFSNIVVVRADLSGQPCFRDVLAGTKEAMLDALEQEDVPFEQLVHVLHPTRRFGENPVFQVLFASVPAAPPQERFGALIAAPYVIEAVAAPFALSVGLIEDAFGNALVRADYQARAVTADEAESLLSHYTRLLASISEQPTASIDGFAPPPWRRATAAQPKRPAPPQPAAAADPALERMLLGVWEKVLRRRAPSPEADFFDLGGHSLQAVLIAHEVGQALGQKIPVSLLFREPTIAGMARRLRTGYLPPSTLIPVFRGGTRPPLFVGGSSSPEFASLSRALEPEQPFFQLDILALQERRLMAGEALLTSIPDIAACFLRDILMVQPHGRYLLAGMCDGGILALEIAHQLQDSGREIAFLAQLDTTADGFFRWTGWAGWLRGKLRTAAKLARAGQLVDRLRCAIIPTAAERQHIATVATIWQAVRDYRQSRRFCGEIQIFRATEQLPFYEDVTKGWEKRAERISVHTVPGNHFSLLFEPVTQQRIAAAIVRALGDDVEDNIA